MEKVRIDRILSKSGFGSRSEVKNYIKQGRVWADGVRIKSPSEKVLPSSVTVDKKEIDYKEFVYILMNKPSGVLSATEDKKQQTVVDLLDERMKSYEPFPVGRLDIDTVGLLLLTNDGPLSHELLSPKKHVEKTYFVKTSKQLSDEDVSALEVGVDIGGYVTKPAKVKKTDDGIHLTITEGKFHQVKKMLESVGNKVTYLQRIKMGALELPENLPEGEYLEITKNDVLGAENQ